MKKVLKKVSMIICTLMVCVGIVGGSTTTADAANYVTNAKVRIQLDMPTYFQTPYTVTLGGRSYSSNTKFLDPKKSTVFTGTVTLPNKDSVVTCTMTYKDSLGASCSTKVYVSRKNYKKTIIIKPKFSTGKFVESITQTTKY